MLWLHARLVGYCDDLVRVEGVLHGLLAHQVPWPVAQRDAALFVPLHDDIDRDAFRSFSDLVQELTVIVSLLREDLQSDTAPPA
jgi:hypothetical protein